MAQKWLKETMGDHLSKEARDRIAVVVNWNKTGGPPSKKNGIKIPEIKYTQDNEANESPIEMIHPSAPNDEIPY